MTDLLGLLVGMHGAVNQLGSLRLAITDLEDMDWVADRRTGTIHLRPGLSPMDGLKAVAAALEILAPTAAEPVRSVAVGGHASSATGPAGQHFSAVPDRSERHLRPVPNC